METEGSSLPHSRIHGDWGWGREEDVSLAAPRVGARRPGHSSPPPSLPFSSHPTVEASSQQEVRWGTGDAGIDGGNTGTCGVR